jgi:hypothetical protein
MHRFFFLITICAALCSCNTAPIEPQAGNFPSSVSSIIGANCLGGNCHTGRTPENTQLDLSTWDAMIKGSVYFNEVIPFNAVKSHFFGHVNTNVNLAPVITPTMPLARDPLSESDQVALFDWIIQGAKSADGKIPYTDVTKKIFAVNQEEDMISVIDAQTQRLIRIITLAANDRPAAIAMLPDQHSFLIGNQGSRGSIAKYDAANYTKLGEFSTNLLAFEIALTPGGSKGYITDNSFKTQKFGVFDPVAMKFINTISSPLILEPTSVAIASSGNYAYISGAASDNIIRIDTRNDSVMGYLLLGTDVPVPASLYYNPKYQPKKSFSRLMQVKCMSHARVVPRS